MSDTFKVSERFWSKVAQTGPNECWLWQAGGSLYGVFWYEGKNDSAHVVAFILTYGYRPPVVMHTCDTPKCCNPVHLQAGTTSLNALDAVQKGQWARQDGVHNGNAKFTEDQILQMRNLYPMKTYQAIANLFGCSLSVAWNIVKGNTYKEVVPGVHVSYI